MKASFGSVLVVVACGALAGCADSGSSGGSSSGPSTPSYVDLISEGDAIFLASQTSSITDMDSLPTTGSAQYDGVVGLEIFADGGGPGYDGDHDGPEGSIFLAGDLTMNVDFDAADPISGSVTNIVESNDDRYAGSLALGASTLDREADPATEWQFWNDLSGTITSPSGEAWTIDTEMRGDFVGDRADFAGGEIEGGACLPTDCSYVHGAFIAGQ